MKLKYFNDLVLKNCSCFMHISYVNYQIKIVKIFLKNEELGGFT